MFPPLQACLGEPATCNLLWAERLLCVSDLPVNIFEVLRVECLLKECIKMGRAMQGVDLGYYRFRNALKPVV